MSDFSTQKSIKDMTHQELLMEYLAVNARNYILEKENQNLNDTLYSVVSLYLGRGKND